MFVGIDLIEIPRIANAAKNERFIQRIYTPAEQAIAEQLSSSRRKVEWYAGRFAVKEAAYKAISAFYNQMVLSSVSDTSLTNQLPALSFLHIETLKNEFGLPELHFYEKAKSIMEHYSSMHAQVSITHSKEQAMAIVIIHDLYSPSL